MTEPLQDLPYGFAAMVENAPDAVVVHDMEDRVIYWNQAAQRLYGWKFDEILNRPVTRIFYKDASLRKAALEQLQDAGHWSGELQQVNRRGAEYLVQVRQHLLRDDKGRAKAVVSFNTDITQNKKAVDLEQRAHHVRSSNLLAGGVAHELNNALAPIMLSAAMLKRKVEDPKARGMLSMIEKCANRGAVLISDLLAYERGRGGGSEIIRRTQIERSLAKLTKELVPQSISVKIEVAEDLWEVRGNMEELSRSFSDVVQNACEAMPEGGALRVQAGNRIFDENFETLAPEAKAGAYVAVIFTDTGHGIERSLLDRVAEPFFTTKEPKQGFGFGLANTLATVKGHNGFMVLDSDVGSGTTVSIFLPSEVTPESVRNTAPPFPLTAEGKGMLVIVADDEFFVRETIRKTLEERGYNVVTAEDGTEALAIYASRLNEVDLVVTNVEMPFMDGPSLCRALKKLNPDVKILISSGHKQPDKIKEIKAAGVDHFLAKPYTADHLADIVQKILDGERAAE